MEGRLSGPLAAALAEREYSTRLPQARQDAPPFPKRMCSLHARKGD